LGFKQGWPVIKMPQRLENESRALCRQLQARADATIKQMVTTETQPCERVIITAFGALPRYRMSAKLSR
jgi:hypothetical protein